MQVGGRVVVPSRVMNVMSVPQGEFKLARYPIRPKEQFRAWDAADEYLLAAVAGEADAPIETPELRGRNVIINDSYGALSVALSEHQPSMVTDSYLSMVGATQNMITNRYTDALDSRKSTDELPFPIDLALVKVPKSLGLLEHQLHQIRQAAHPGTVVIAAGMARHIHTSTLEMFSSILGPTTTSLAKKKARLIFPTIDFELEVGASLWPKSFTTDDGLVVHSHAGVFSAGKLDPGTRFFLENPPKIGEGARLVDLGCGNGVLGTVFAQQDTDVAFLDKSFLALESAKATYEDAFPGGEARFVAGDGADELSDDSVDIVVNNPPFHDDQALAEATAWKMFNDAFRILKPGGEFWVVGNRHLGYHAKLSKLFGSRTTVASNNKFVVLRAKKPLR